MSGVSTCSQYRIDTESVSIRGSCYWGCIFKICLPSRWAAARGVGREVVLGSFVSNGGFVLNIQPTVTCTWF